MKFFNNLPKTTFTTSIGNFVISDFFTYLDITKKQLDSWGAKYNELILGKPSADFYIDDKNISLIDFFTENN